MTFLPVIVVLLFVFAFSPTTKKGRRGRSKGFFATLLDGQKQTEKRNGSHRGVMSPPGGSKRR